MVVDHVIWGLIGGAPPSTRLGASIITNSTTNATQPSSSLIAPSPTSTAFIDAPLANISTPTSMPGLVFRQFLKDRITIPLFNTTANATYNTLDHLAQDTFEGQMLTCAIILFFVAIFLLREWCLQNLPQAMPEQGNGIAFAPAVQPIPAPAPLAIMPEPELPAGLDWQVPENEQAGALIPRPQNEAEQPIAEGEDAADHSPRMRPRLRHGVPDPPELQQVRAAEEDDEEGDEDEVIMSMEEMRRRRDERFGPSSYRDQAAESSHIDRLDVRDNEAEADVTASDLSNIAEKGKARVSGTIDAEYEENEEVEEDEDIWEDSHALFEHGKDESQQGASSSKIEDNLESLALDDDAGTAFSVADIEEDAETEVDEMVEGDVVDQEEVMQPVEEQRNNEVAAQVEPAIDAHDWEDEVDNGERLEDDMDGMMEAVGLQGPLINLFTNMLMMFVLCSFVLVIAVALPYLIGRIFGVGTNFYKFVSLPAKGLRFFTDPLVDYIVMKSAKGIDKVLQTTFIRKVIDGRIARVFISGVQMAKGSTWYQQAVLRVSILFQGASTTAADTAKSSSDQIIAIASKQTPRSKEALEASVVALGSNIRTQYAHLSLSLRKAYIKAEAKTQGVSQDDKMFCVLLGHLYWLIGLFIQKRLSSLYLRWNLRWLKNTVDQQLVVFKVLAFIILELAIFPWCCGVLLDISLFPLWQDVTLSSRIALIKSKPLSVGFTQWSLGTLYMFALAQFVSNTRSIVRPGVLCFVRDAGDPGFHPIKDILERKSGEQLRKIGVSGIIYSGILAATIGFCSHLVYLADRQAFIFPLRWEMHQSLTTTGFEYVFIAVALPSIIKSGLQTSLLKKGIKAWWKKMARILRISSYLIGGPFEDERGYHVGKSWRAALFGINDADNQSTMIHDGGFGRVPADDQAIMSSPIVIRTDEAGEPLTERGREAVQQQQEAIDKLTKKPQYTVVYLPPHFRARIISLIVALWATISASFLVMLLLPLLMGRFIVDSILGSSDSHPPLHDGYSWLVGVILIGAITQIAKTARRLSKSTRPSRRLAKMARRTAEYAWMFFFISLTGCLFGICVELYINGLARPFISTKSALLPDISLLHSCCTGILLLFTVVQIIEFARGPMAPLDWDKMSLTGACAFYAVMDVSVDLRKSDGDRC
jgi:E3 ubiquitin-protein ligase MARCH6